MFSSSVALYCFDLLCVFEVTMHRGDSLVTKLTKGDQDHNLWTLPIGFPGITLPTKLCSGKGIFFQLFKVQRLQMLQICEVSVWPSLHLIEAWHCFFVKKMASYLPMCFFYFFRVLRADLPNCLLQRASAEEFPDQCLDLHHGPLDLPISSIWSDPIESNPSNLF